MAAISSTGSGTWPACLSATPTLADDVTINFGHLVVVPSGVAALCKTITLNHTAGTTGLRIELGGSLQIDQASAATYAQTALQMNPSANSTTPGVIVAGTLITYQGLAIGSASFSAPLQVVGGGRIEGRGHLAAHGTQTAVQIGLVNQTSPNGRLETSGASVANPAVFSHLYVTNGGFNGGGTPRLDGAQFLNCGSSTQPVFTWQLLNGTFNTEFVNCVFDGCGRVVNNASSMAASHVCRYEHVTIKNSVTAVNVPSITTGPGSALTTGTRTMWDVRSDRQINVNAPSFDWSDVVADVRGAGATNAPPLSLGTSASFPRFEKTIARFNSSSNGGGTWNLPYGTTADRLYVMGNGTSNGHPVGVGASASAAASTTNVTRFLYQTLTLDAQTDFTTVGVNPTNAQSVILRNGICLPCATDHTKQSGIITSPLGNLSNLKLTVEHCTIFTGGGGGADGVQCGETQSSNIGQLYDAVRSNLAVGLGSGSDRWLVSRISTFNQQDLLAPATTDYNGKFNLSTGTDGVGYNGNGGVALVSTGTLGAHDVVADPQFVSGTTYPDLGSYYAFKKGTTGTVLGDFDAAFDEMMNRNPDFAPGDVIDWILARYAPTNSALNAAHDAGAPTTSAGATMGAVARVAPPDPTIVLTPSATIRFTVREGDPDPTPVTFTITNSGSGTLDGLSVSVSAGAAAWLAASLSGASATPSVTGTVTPTIAGLTRGDYLGTLTIASTAPFVTNTPQTIAVELHVDAPQLVAPTLNPPGTPTGTRVPLTWTAATGGATPITYDVQVGIGATPASWVTVFSGLAGLAATVAGLNQSTLYAFRVIARDTSEQEATSGTQTQSTTADPDPATGGADVFGIDRRRRRA